MTNLSDKLTLLYKIMGLLFTIIIVSIAIGFAIYKSIFGILFSLMALLTWRAATMYRIKYDDTKVEVRSWMQTKTYPLSSVKALNEGYLLGIDPFFEIEVIEDGGIIRSFHFKPTFFDSLNYMFTKKLTGHLMVFEMYIRRARK